MNTRSLVVLIVALAWSVAAPVSGREREDVASPVKVAPPVIHFVADRARVRAECRTNRAWACTDFAGERLSATCVVGDGGWRIDAEAEWKPVMFVGSAMYVQHETLHIAHVKRLAAAHVFWLEEQLFDSATECAERAARAREVFPALMNGFRAESNAALH